MTMLDLTDKQALAARSESRSRPRPIRLCVNGEWHELLVRPRHTLVEVIRDRIGLTGTKASCQSGACGACTVLLEGRPTLGCLTLAVECDGQQVTTVEGLADGERLSVVQQAFLDQGAVQCGFCTPGMLMSATALLRDNPRPDRAAINKALEGNLCRCTGYNAIVDAIRQASGQGVAPVMECAARRDQSA
jgi:carbon-monoxide dehydrogenase small subunit